MSHKITVLDWIRKTLWIPVLCLLWMTTTGLAQETQSPDEKGQDAEIQSPDQEPSDEQWPTPIPVQGEEEGKGGKEIKSRGLQSFGDDVFQNLKNRFGFSLSFNEAYSNSVSRNSQIQQGASFQSFLPRAFLNLGKRKSTFHVDIGAGWRGYNQHHELNSWDYYGNAQYSYQLSKKSMFGVTNQYTSSYNDAWSFISLYSPLQYNLFTSNEILFNTQRINRDSLMAQLDYRIGRRVGLGFFGHYRC